MGGLTEQGHLDKVPEEVRGEATAGKCMPGEGARASGVPGEHQPRGGCWAGGQGSRDRLEKRQETSLVSCRGWT